MNDRYRSLILVVLQTLFGAAAQILIKKGADPAVDGPAAHGLISTLVRIFMNPYMFGGYALLGLSSILLVLALRKGQLSMLQPVIALTFVWVAILSVVLYHETLSPIRIAGVATVVVGVGLIGFGDGDSSPARETR